MLADHPNYGNDERKAMVRELISTVDGDEAPSIVDGGVALRGSLLNAPRNLFMTTSYSRQKWWQ